MRFIHIADVHLGVTPDVGMPWSEKRGKDIWNSFHMVLEEARRQQADLLLIAGDLFHRQPLKRELKEVAAGFAAIPDTEIVLTMIICIRSLITAPLRGRIMCILF